MYLRFQIRRAVRALDRILVDLGLAVRTNLGRDLRFWLRSRTVQLVQSLDDHEDHEGGEQKLYDDLNEICSYSFSLLPLQALIFSGCGALRGSC